MVGETQVDGHVLIARAAMFRMEHDPELGLYHLPFGSLQRVRLAKQLLAGSMNVRLIGRIDFDCHPPNPTHGRQSKEEDLNRLDAVGGV